MVVSWTVAKHMLPPIFQASVYANFKIMILVFLGVLATIRGVFDQKGISDLGKLVYHISLPSLLLVNILKEVTIDRAAALAIMPVFCTLHVAFAYCLASALNCLFKISDVEERPVIATIMFGNAGALAIAVLDSLCSQHPYKDVFAGRHECSSKSTSFVAFYLVTQNVLMFTWGERILIRQAKEERAKERGIETPVHPLMSSDVSGRDRQTIHVPSLTAMVYNANDEGEGGGLSRPSSAIDLLDIDRPSPSSDHCEASRRNSGIQSPIPLSDFLNKEQKPVRKNSLTEEQKQELQLRLTRAALYEVSSRIPLEIKAWAPEHHGGSAAIRQMYEDDDEFEIYPSIEGLHGLLTPESRKTLAQSCRSWARRRCRNVQSTVLRWSFRRCYRGTRRRLINLNRAFWALLKNPPLQAAAIGLLIGIIPQFKGLFIENYGQNKAPLRPVYEAVKTLGLAQVPVSMLMLSGSGTLRYLKKVEKALEKSLNEADVDAPSFSFSRRAVAIMIFGRLIGIPLFGWLLWWFFYNMDLLPKDPLIGLVLLLEGAVPSTQNVVMLLLVHGELAQGAAMAEVLLRQYVIAIPIFTIFVAMFSLFVV